MMLNSNDRILACGMASEFFTTDMGLWNTPRRRSPRLCECSPISTRRTRYTSGLASFISSSRSTPSLSMFVTKDPEHLCKDSPARSASSTLSTPLLRRSPRRTFGSRSATSTSNKRTYVVLLEPARCCRETDLGCSLRAQKLRTTASSNGIPITQRCSSNLAGCIICRAIATLARKGRSIIWRSLWLLVSRDRLGGSAEFPSSRQTMH